MKTRQHEGEETNHKRRADHDELWFKMSSNRACCRQAMPLDDETQDNHKTTKLWPENDSSPVCTTKIGCASSPSLSNDNAVCVECVVGESGAEGGPDRPDREAESAGEDRGRDTETDAERGSAIESELTDGEMRVSERDALPGAVLALVDSIAAGCANKSNRLRLSHTTAP